MFLLVDDQHAREQFNLVPEEVEIMGVRHRDYPIHGVQFHQESILTEHGRELLKNSLRL